jgi:hypothetical protein
MRKPDLRLSGLTGSNTLQGAQGARTLCKVLKVMIYRIGCQSYGLPPLVACQTQRRLTGPVLGPGLLSRGQLELEQGRLRVQARHGAFPVEAGQRPSSSRPQKGRIPFQE